MSAKAQPKTVQSFMDGEILLAATQTPSTYNIAGLRHSHTPLLIPHQWNHLHETPVYLPNSSSYVSYLYLSFIRWFSNGFGRTFLSAAMFAQTEVATNYIFVLSSSELKAINHLYSASHSSMLMWCLDKEVRYALLQHITCTFAKA